MALSGILVSILASAAQTPSSTSTPNRLPSRQPQIESCIAVANPQWSEPEHRVWQSLCNNRTADLSQSSSSGANPVVSECQATFDTYRQTPRDPVSYENDPARRIRGEFLREIVSDDSYVRYLRDSPIRITGAYITSTHINSAAIQSLRIDNSLIEDMQLINVKADLWLSFCDFVRVKNSLVLEGVSTPKLDFYRVHVDNDRCFLGTGPCLRIEGGLMTNLSIVFVSARKIEVSSVRLEGSLFTNENETIHLMIDQTKAAGLTIYRSTISSLFLNDIDLARQLTIAGIRWQHPPADSKTEASELRVRGLSAAGLHYDGGPVLPDRVTFEANTLGTIFLGNDPLAVLRRINQQSGNVLDLYANTAKSYSARGRVSTARELLYQRDILADNSDAGFKGARLISRFVVGYGYYPERGLLYIGAFVLLGWVIFASGERQMKNSDRPHSWFVFALDTVIPGLALDPKSSQVSFRGFRQYYLYFMRLLGAGLAFLVLVYLKQTFIGPE